MSEDKKQTGGCQCGGVRYEVTLDLTKPVLQCNCSMCGRRGSLLAFTPAARFKLLSGEELLTEYLFNKKQIRHLFCKVCGIHSFGTGTGQDGVEQVGVNARCLDDVDPKTLPIMEFDGKHRL